MKACTQCGVVKPLSDFHASAGRPDGRRSNCKACVSAYSRLYAATIADETRERRKERQRRWRNENLDEARQRQRERYRANPERRKRAEREKRYGISHDDYVLLREAQEDTCEICFRTETATHKGQVRELCVDHDHETGLIRGLLCSDCNRAIGLLGDDPERAEAVAAYLRDVDRLFRETVAEARAAS